MNLALRGHHRPRHTFLTLNKHRLGVADDGNFIVIIWKVCLKLKGDMSTARNEDFI